MQAFAPLNEAVLQRKRDEFNAVQRRGELRLQAALAEEAQVRQQKFTQEENERNRTFQANESLANRNFQAGESFADRELREKLTNLSLDNQDKRLSAELQQRRFEFGVNVAANQEQRNLERERIKIQEGAALLERQKFAASQNELQKMASDIASTYGQFNRFAAMADDKLLSDFERTEARTQAAALGAVLSMTAGRAHMELNGGGDGVETIRKYGQLFKRPDPIKPVIMTDAMGAQQAFIEFMDEKGNRFLQRMPQKNPDGSPVVGGGGGGAFALPATRSGNKPGKENSKGRPNVPNLTGGLNSNSPHNQQ